MYVYINVKHIMLILYTVLQIQEIFEYFAFIHSAYNFHNWIIDWDVKHTFVHDRDGLK